MVKKTDWKTIKIIILIFNALFMLVLNPTLENYTTPHVRISDLLFIAICIFVGFFFMIWFGSRKSDTSNWKKLDWSSSPFSLQPIILGNFFGWMMLTGYFLPTIFTWIKYPQYILDGVLPMSIGLIMIFVTNISSKIFIE